MAAGPDGWVYVVENYSNHVSLFDECCMQVREVVWQEGEE